jgi:hypothetical protein
VRGWLADGRIGDPRWTVEQLERVRDRPGSRAQGAKAAHGTLVRMRKAAAATGAAQRKRIGRGIANEQRQTSVSLNRSSAAPRPATRWPVVSCCLEGFSDNRLPCLGQGAPRPQIGDRPRCGPGGNRRGRTGGWHQRRVHPGLRMPRLAVTTDATARPRFLIAGWQVLLTTTQRPRMSGDVPTSQSGAISRRSGEGQLRPRELAAP